MMIDEEIKMTDDGGGAKLKAHNLLVVQGPTTFAYRLRILLAKYVHLKAAVGDTCHPLHWFNFGSLRFEGLTGLSESYIRTQSC